MARRPIGGPALRQISPLVRDHPRSSISGGGARRGRTLL